MGVTATYLFWSALVTAAYVSWCMIRAQVNRKTPIMETGFSRPVSIIIACYNEEAYICRRLESLLDERNWIAGSEIIVVSSGCSDNTNFILRHFSHYPYVKVITPAERWSKIRALNYAVSVAANEILVFSDCRQRVKPGSVKALVKCFSDERIAVAGARLCDDGSHRRSSLIRRVINFISTCESAAGCGVNLHGALYAQRRNCFRPIPEDIIFDDLFVIASTMSQQKRIVFVAEAVIYDLPFAKYYSGERIERLVRGLLLFITRHGSMISDMRSQSRLSFLLFKYGKLLFPIWCATLITLFIHDCIFYFPSWMISLSVFVFAWSMLIPPVTRVYKLVLKFNVHALKEMFCFFFFHSRAVHWEKLIVSKV